MIQLCVCVCVCAVLSHVQLFATLWTAAHQAPLSMGSPGKNNGVGYHVLLQGIFQTRVSNPGDPYCRRIIYHLIPQGSPQGDVEKQESLQTSHRSTHTL